MRSSFVLAATALATALAGCAGADPTGEPLGTSAAALAAECAANVRGVGVLDTEAVYLPSVVTCENGGAPLEALKAQAIAARTYLYYKLETSDSIGDGQGDQVYSCGTAASALAKQAVAETAGLVLRYQQQTICAFYVAGGAASGPACRGASSSTESYVTYNEGRSGSAIDQSSLGWISPTNTRNRGCMSQLGSRCLADQGKTYEDILRFYYGADIVLERATGSCITAPAEPPEPGAETEGEGQEGSGDGPPEASDDEESASMLGQHGARRYEDSAVGCALSPGRRAGTSPLLVVFAALALTLGARRRAMTEPLASLLRATR